MKIVWVVVAIVGAHLIGIDKDVIMATIKMLASDPGVAGMVSSSPPAAEGSAVGNVTLPTLAAAYAYLRSDLKKQREKGGDKNANPTS
jgi:hypothetical protein